MPRVPFREESHHVADWMVRFVADGLGPKGGWKLIDEDEPILLDSPASALREMRLPDGAAGFYKKLATDVQAAVGDGGSLAVYLAAHLVRSYEKSHREGIPLAKRQLLAWLESKAAPHEWALPELEELARNGTIALDDVDIRVDKPGWHNGLALTPQFGPKQDGTGNVLLVHSWKRALQTAARARGNFVDAERQQEQRRIQQVQQLGVGLVVCLGEVPEGVGIALQNRGVWVHHNASKSLVRRLERATGAMLVPTLQEATATELGTADWKWDEELIVEGPGPAATFGVEAENQWAGTMAKDLAERQLRLAGALLVDDRAVPAGWHKDAADALRKVSHLAPGRAPLGMQAVAEALDGFSTALHGASQPDPLVAVKLSVDAGLSTALQIISIDERLEKRQSSGAAIRGGGSKIGSPKGMPGDVPPLM